MCDEFGNYVGEGYSDDSNSESYSSTTFTAKKARNKELDEARRLDPGYNKIYRVLKKTVDGNTVSKRVSIEFYTTSSTPGKMIRSAISGSYHTNFRVGKHDEDIFFKVGLSTGECNSFSNTLFFDTPEQYEKVFFVDLKPEIKNDWYAKFNAERKYRETEALKQESRATVTIH
jgi:hypothetical protein